MEVCGWHYVWEEGYAQKEFKKIGDPNEVFEVGYLLVFAWILFGVGIYLISRLESVRKSKITKTRYCIRVNR